jgi:hypothetical protein
MKVVGAEVKLLMAPEHEQGARRAHSRFRVEGRNMIGLFSTSAKFSFTIALAVLIPIVVFAQPVETVQNSREPELNAQIPSGPPPCTSNAAQSELQARALQVKDALPNGQKQELKTHTPPAPPPSSGSAPQFQLLRLPEGKAKEYTNPRRDVLTYHYDNKRSGWNSNEVDLTPKSVASPQFSLLETLSVDGNVFAQPLLVSNFEMPDGQEHDVLVIATGHNTLCAYDANSFSLFWHVSLGQAQQFLDVGCADVQPEYGITSTPVIVRKSKNSATVYVVSAIEPRALDFHTFIHAIDLRTGQDAIDPSTGKTISPQEIAPSATLKDGSQLKFNPQDQWSRAGLAYNDGVIYVSIGSHCDNDAANISGWLLKYSENLALTAGFHTVSTPKGRGLSSIWMTGFAPAIDDAGNLFLATGNGDVSPPDDYGQSVLKLDGKTLGVIDYFTPSNYSVLNIKDGDFGSGGVSLFSTGSAGSKRDVAAAIGKDPVLYLLDQANLGKNQTNDAGALQALRIKPCQYSSQCRGVWGGVAIFQSQNGLLLYSQAEHDVMRSYLMGGAPAPSVTPSAAGVSKAGYGGSIPIVSSNGSANGVVWLLARTEPAIELEAYDATSLGPALCTVNVGPWSNPGYGNSFLSPMVANGRVYAAAYNVVKVFGLGTQGMTAMTRASRPLQ